MNTSEGEGTLNDVAVGQWKISHAYGILASAEGKTLVLEPRLSKLLYLLSLHSNSIVTRQYLIDNIWQDTIVNEDSLTRAVADLRKLPSNNFDNAIEIETIRKRGYRLSMQIGPRQYSFKLKINNQSRHWILGLVIFLLILLLIIIYWLWHWL